MSSKKTAQYGHPSLDRKTSPNTASGFENPIIKVSVSGGVVYNGLEIFWAKQMCESKEYST